MLILEKNNLNFISCIYLTPTDILLHPMCLFNILIASPTLLRDKRELPSARILSEYNRTN